MTRDDDDDIDLWDEMGVPVVPLFEFKKFPVYPGYRGEFPLRAAAMHIRKMAETGMQPAITGKYALMNGMGAVIDLEGRKWKGVSETSLPSWLIAMRDVCNESLPTWVSAGGDGGKRIRNVLLPYAYEDLVHALGLEGVPGNTHRVPIGSEGKGELLLKCGVCIPISHIVSDDGVKSVVAWTHVGTGGRPHTVVAARALARGVMPDILDVLRQAVVDAAESGRKAGIGDTGQAPVVKEVEIALFVHGPNAGLEVTRQFLDAGVSRHYLAKTWANWALVTLGPALVRSAGGDRLRALEIVGEQIMADWAEEAGFTMRETMKSVNEEAKFLSWSRTDATGDWS